MPPGTHLGQVLGVTPYKLCHRRALRESVAGGTLLCCGHLYPMVS